MILVTGATGFLGSEIVRQLISLDKPIRAMKRSTSRIPAIFEQQKAIDWVDADVLDHFSLQEAFDGITQVYHCAGMVSCSSADKQKMLQTNVQGTANVVNVCLDRKIQKLVHVSSVATLGEAKPNSPLTEDCHWDCTGIARGVYAQSKYEGELEVFRAIAEGLCAVVVNPSMIVGKNAGENGTGAFFKMVQKGLTYYPRGSCGLVAVEDVAESMIALMNSDFSAERYIVNAENWLYRDLFAEIAHQLRVESPGKELKPWASSISMLTNLLASLLRKKSHGLTKEMTHRMVKKSVYVNSKIRDAIGFEFRPIQQVIAEICDQGFHADSKKAIRSS